MKTKKAERPTRQLRVVLKEAVDGVPAGKEVIVLWVSERHKDGGHYIHFGDPDIQGRFIDAKWDNVEKPVECTLIQAMIEGGYSVMGMGSYAQGQIMGYVYCADRDDFVGVEPGRKDITNCPLCGKPL